MDNTITTVTTVTTIVTTMTTTVNTTVTTTAIADIADIAYELQIKHDRDDCKNQQDSPVPHGHHYSC